MVVAAVAIATLLAAWLRLHGITAQIVQDDEWHALHKLMASGYAEIFRSFGQADHSIPLTLLYKAMADTVGLAEGRMRALQVTCGIALVPIAALLSWRALRNAPASALFAFLAAGAPFLVLYSRLARPYAITLLLLVLVLAGLWRWRESRSPRLAAGIALLAALSAWLHPLSAVFPAVACVFVLGEDLAARHTSARRPLQSLALGAAVAAAMLAPLAAPLAHDVASLTAKAGGDHASFRTLARMASIFGGGLPDAVTVIAVGVATFGGWRVARERPRLAAYLAALVAAPIAFIAAVGAAWSHQGHTFGRYVFPVQLVVLFLAAYGAIALLRLALPRRSSSRAEWSLAAVLAIAYLAANPAIGQVARLGAWYAHIYHQYDYVPRYNVVREQYRGFEPPAFYRRLGEMPAGSAPVIEAPFTAGGPANAFAFFALFHRQPERMGMLHDLCLDGPRLDEVPPRDRRFRFRGFVFLDDVDGVKASGARYLLLYREQIHGRPFHEQQRCIDALTLLYGPAARLDARLAVWDLQPTRPSPKLQ